MKLALALLVAFSTFATAAAAETDTISVSAVVLESCFVETEGQPRVRCDGRAAADETSANEATRQLPAADIETITAPEGGTMVVVTY